MKKILKLWKTKQRLRRENRRLKKRGMEIIKYSEKLLDIEKRTIKRQAILAEEIARKVMIINGFDAYIKTYESKSELQTITEVLVKHDIEHKTLSIGDEITLRMKVSMNKVGGLGVLFVDLLFKRGEFVSIEVRGVDAL